MDIHLSDDCSKHPGVASLIAIGEQLKLTTLAEFKPNQSVDWSFFWEPLLLQKELPSLYQFPPDMLISFARTLEVQATQLVLSFGLNTETRINVHLENPEHSFIVKSADSSAEQDETRISRWIKQHCAVIENTEASTEHFQLSTFTSTLSPSEQSLFNFIFGLTPALHSKEEGTTALADIIQQQMIQFDAEMLEQMPLNLERHYVHASLNMNDDILLDKTFTQSQVTTEDRLFARLLFAYANIRCSLALPQSELDQLIEECEKNDLGYWKGYLLVYGHIVREFDPTYRLNDEFKRLNEAHLCFKQLGDYLAVTRVYHAKASILGKLKQFNAAIRLLGVCFNVRRSLQDSFGAAKISNGIAYIYLQLDQFDQAIHNHQLAIDSLEHTQQFGELAFTYSQLSWIQLLNKNFKDSIQTGLKMLKTMESHNIHTLSFRTKPDLHAQLGLSYYFSSDIEKAVEHSNYCEKHKVDSTATGDVLRTLLRGLINDSREQAHLADISFSSIPELLEENPDVDIHVELLYLKCQIDRLRNAQQLWNVEKYLSQARRICTKNNLTHSATWFSAI